MIENIINSDFNLGQALNFLSQADKGLAKIINKDINISLKKRGSGFSALLKTIISQQLSTAAAKNIWCRFIDRNLINKNEILMADNQTLQSLGLSKQKCSYVRSLASSDIDYESLTKMSSEEVINKLIKIKGIGRWTAEIYCLFSLGHANIFPAGDLALQESIKMVFNLPKRPTEQESSKISNNWHPWKSVAAHLLWDYYRKKKSKV